MIDLGKFQNQIPRLAPLSPNRYENIFKLYQDENFLYYYNILNTVIIPEEIDKSFYYNVTINRRVPWTTISYEQYGNIDLWWLICLINKIKNPIKYAEQGQELKILKQEYISIITESIKKLINS